MCNTNKFFFFWLKFIYFFNVWKCIKNFYHFLILFWGNLLFLITCIYVNYFARSSLIYTQSFEKRWVKRAPVWTRLFYNTSTETHSFVKLSYSITHCLLNVTLKTKRSTSHIARLSKNGLSSTSLWSHMQNIWTMK